MECNTRYKTTYQNIQKEDFSKKASKRQIFGFFAGADFRHRIDHFKVTA